MSDAGNSVLNDRIKHNYCRVFCLLTSVNRVKRNKNAMDCCGIPSIAEDYRI